MLVNLSYGLPTMVLCLLFQVMLLIYTFRYYLDHQDWMKRSSVWPHFLLISIVMLLLVIGNLGQIAIWSMLFIYLGEFKAFNVAFYHSAVNFASLGYGDIVMSEKYRLLGALEAVNGVLMIGVSTAALMGPFKDSFKTTLSR